MRMVTGIVVHSYLFTRQQLLFRLFATQKKHGPASKTVCALLPRPTHPPTSHPVPKVDGRTLQTQCEVNY